MLHAGVKKFYKRVGCIKVFNNLRKLILDCSSPSATADINCQRFSISIHFDQSVYFVSRFQLF